MRGLDDYHDNIISRYGAQNLPVSRQKGCIFTVNHQNANEYQHLNGLKKLSILGSEI